MNDKEIVPQNPFRFIEDPAGNILSENAFGALLGRAGIGKTAFLVQLALTRLMQKQNVLHVSLIDPVNKVTLWYEEVFAHLAGALNMKSREILWESILPHRFILTFNADAFSVPKLEKRVTDLLEQKIFFPRMMVLDGLHFDASASAILDELKALAVKHKFHVWFSVRTHRNEKSGPEDIPSFFSKIIDRFEVIIRLKPEHKEIRVKILKAPPLILPQLPWVLDPSTMLLTKK